MKFLEWAPDGGKDSGVMGFFFVEIKPLFSIVLLKFSNGSREAYHSHAFNAVTRWLKGKVIEHRVFPALSSGNITFGLTQRYLAGDWKITKRDNMHRVESIGESWALSFRGPWKKTWQELKNGEVITLSSGRKIICHQPLGYNDRVTTRGGY